MKKSVLLSVLVLTACGTIFSGSTQQLTFDSNVKNINIYAMVRWFVQQRRVP